MPCACPGLRAISAKSALRSERAGWQNADHQQRAVDETQQMCRNIKMLFNFEPPVTDDEIQAAALQFVRKVSGFNKPSLSNEPAFNAAVRQIAASSAELLRALKTNAPPRDRATEAAKARGRAATRFHSLRPLSDGPEKLSR
jgi:hypothetical protein